MSLDRRSVRVARQLLRTDLLMGVGFVPVSGAVVPTTPVGIEEPREVPTRAAAAAASAAPSRPMPTRPAAPVVPVAPSAPAPASVEPALLPVAIEAKPRTLSPRQRESQARLDALRVQYERDAPHSKFVTDHHCIVFGDGDPCARLMIIGEAPGAEEDKVGLPFVGKAGQLLEKMLGAMGIRRSEVYITNVLKTRPPNNATPTADEAAACAPYLYEQIKIIGPEVILALGLPATRVLLNTTEAMSRLRGQWWDYTDPRTIGYQVPVMPTYHPAFLLRSYTRENREKVWSDLQMVMQRLGISPPAGRSGAMTGA